MKRSGPLQRRTPLTPGSGLGRAPLRARSVKRERLMREDRRPRIEAIVAEGVGCLIGPLLVDAGLDVRCSGRVEGLHERRKRSAGGSLVNPENLIPACNRCNGFVEDEPRLVRELFGSVLVVREGDEEWVRLGRRADS